MMQKQDLDLFFGPCDQRIRKFKYLAPRKTKGAITSQVQITQGVAIFRVALVLLTPLIMIPLSLVEYEVLFRTR